MSSMWKQKLETNILRLRAIEMLGGGQNFHLRKSIMRVGVIIATSSLVKVELMSFSPES